MTFDRGLGETMMRRWWEGLVVMIISISPYLRIG